jgi:transposase
VTTGLVVIVFVAFICLGLIIYYMRLPMCRKCNIRMKLIKTHDPWGINITDNITLNFFTTNLFSRKIERRYRCPKCGETENIVSRETDLPP